MSRVPDEPRLPDRDLPSFTRQMTDLWRGLAQQVNQLSEGRAVASYAAVAAMPTSGTYYTGDFVQNSAPAILGTPGSRYVIEGWKRITNGSTHVAGTDWVEKRFLTGT